MPITRETAVALYGSVPCRFSRYYKFSFHSSGVADDGALIHLSTGGNSSDIYRYEVGPDDTKTMEDAYAVTITKSGETIFESYDD